MAKVQIKSEKLTPFGGFFSIMEQFDFILSPVIDQALGQRCSSIIGIQFELNSILVEKWEGKCYRLVIQRQKRIDGNLDLWEGEYTYRCILTNDYISSTRDVVEDHYERA